MWKFICLIVQQQQQQKETHQQHQPKKDTSELYFCYDFFHVTT